jgi:hypothetical protein
VVEKTPSRRGSGRAFPIWSGREDLNLRPPEPHEGARRLMDCRQASPTVAGRRRPGESRGSPSASSSPRVAMCSPVSGPVTTKRNYQGWASASSFHPTRHLDRASICVCNARSGPERSGTCLPDVGHHLGRELMRFFGHWTGDSSVESQSLRLGCPIAAENPDSVPGEPVVSIATSGSGGRLR